MIAAGLHLARRLESAEARIGAACAPESAVLEAAGGSAIFAGAASPLTHAVGLGMQGPVRADEIGRIEEFYAARGAAVTVDLCPLADASLVELLAVRGYRVTEFNNVLVRALAGVEIGPPGAAVRPARADEEELWAHTVGRGFLEKDVLSSEEMDVGRAIWRMPGSRCYLAFHGGQAAAAAAMAVENGLAALFADSTAPGSRGAGLHAALIRVRLHGAAAAGCDLATAATLPGSVSQRNYERQGFQVAYTKAILIRPAAGV